MPGDFIGALPVNSFIQPAGLPINTSTIKVLRRPIETSQYTSFAFTQRLIDEGVDPSVGSIGDAYDNALAESQIGIYKTELIRSYGPWRDVDQVELETLHWVDWFNQERPHESIDDLTPAQAEQVHYAARNGLSPTG